MTAITRPAGSPEQDGVLAELREGIQAFIKAEIIPRHEANAAYLGHERGHYDDSGRYTPRMLELMREVRMASAKAGFYGMSAPESIGGSGLGLQAYLAAWEQVFRTCGARYFLGHSMIAHWAKGPSPVLLNITAAARERYLPRIISGEASMCFALSEPGAGSDVMAMKTRATPDGDGWRLNGGKIWVTNSPYADFLVVFAVTEPALAAARRGGISCFLVPAESPGFSVESIIKMWGHVGGDEGILRFEDVRLEPWQLIGTLHKGFGTALLGVNLGRIYNIARAIGLGRWALEQSVEYLKVRETFGQKLQEYQGVTFPLAEAAMRLHASHLMGSNAARLLDSGDKALKELAMAKAYAVESGLFAVDRAMQTHGAMGFTNEMHLTEAFVMLRKINVADGTAEILRRQVVRRLLDGDLEL